MMDYTKYKRQYYMPPEECLDWVKKEYVDKAIDFGGDLVNQIKDKLNLDDDKPVDSAEAKPEEPDDTPKN